MTKLAPIHPDDVLFFHDVRDAMKRVAAEYKLPLRAVTVVPMPEKGMSDLLGFCSHDGNVSIVLRATVDGEWCSAPRSPDEVWSTAAHELAHLRHMNHGPKFNEFWSELREALRNRQEDYRQKVLARLVKMQASRDSEAAIGNAEAADAFAAAINRMLIENELKPSDVDYARGSDRDPVIEVSVDLRQYAIEDKKTRVAWQEALARVVAGAHLCTFLVRPGSNWIAFVGTRSHAIVAEYAFGVLVPAAQKMCDTAYHEYGMECGRAQGLKKWVAGEPGYRETWLTAFTNRIAERFREARQAAVTQAAADVPGGTTEALMRLDGAVQKVKEYIDNKFKGKRGASGLATSRVVNHSGAASGRAAADRMAIGRKGVTAGVKGLLKA